TQLPRHAATASLSEKFSLIKRGDTVGELTSAAICVSQLGRDKARCLMVRLLIPPTEPDWRLSPHPALPPWSISDNNARSVPSHFLNSMDVHPCTACAFAQYLCPGLSKG